jgi:dolichol kinase
MAFLADAAYGLLLFASIVAVLYLSKLIKNPYISRKCIHMWVGVVIVAIPLLIKDPAVVGVFGILLTSFTMVPHMRSKELPWFQFKENFGEVYFAALTTLLLTASWHYDVWLAVTSLLFMAWGDGVTGIVRNFKYHRRYKGIAGTYAMIAVSLPVGFVFYGWSHGWAFGWIGVAGALAASYVEKLDVMDDNVSIPVFGYAVMFVLQGLLGVAPLA